MDCEYQFNPSFELISMDQIGSVAEYEKWDGAEYRIIGFTRKIR